MKRCPSLASLTFLTAAATCALLSGCLSRPPLPTADVATPAAYRHASSAAGGDIVSADWWRSFGSVELDRLVAQASARNNDLAAAVARVKQARASATIAGAARLPSVTGFADASRVGGFMINDNLPSGSAFDLGLSASYEIDFWGKNRATRDAAIERVRASAFDRATVLMTLTADVADGWLQTVALRERETLAERNLHTAREILRTVESQFRAGYVTALDVAQQRTLVASQQRTVASLHQQADDSEALLATLLGVPATGFAVATRTLDSVGAPDVDAGVPSSLLVRRPDVAFAEAQLAAAHADVAAARAAMFPSITLTAYVGTGGDQVRRIFDNPLYSLADGFTAPIFDAGALAAGRDLALAQEEELLAAYRQAIVTAFADVERALNAIAGADAQHRAQDDERHEAQHTLELARSRYQAGAQTALTVLDAQRTLYSADDELIQTRLARLLAAVSMYRALGGGWHADNARTRHSIHSD
ncbi:MULTISPECIES: efflux transporter outer membrane subunit [unclassified Caballeronia]|uniref:efflux transporter outer membrane subunit n=1 Tax=unclassified Caballeronia TaxID=2646786 RepID=UPI00285C4C2C|nr:MULTISPECIES: efflux transporter outer membrane subunit [unclassified Caballeronia]MDR5776835.1 efflux transporter outer membrane subunit [Caballeronia sp. LZ002]MDR5852275.1 efflux transporter outer membrane subunit [Caballeronia sp. LZ003]